MVLPLMGLACDSGPGTGKAPPPAAPTQRRVGAPYSSPRQWTGQPSFEVKLVDFKVDWEDSPQQTFKLAVTNTGAAPETVHVIVYGTNESIQPPRRALSPPSAADWFRVAGSKDGKLSPHDIEDHWKATKQGTAFLSARGQKVPFSHALFVPARATKVIDTGAHALDDTSPHEATRGQRLERVPFTEYKVWLFTEDGRWFKEVVLPVKQ